MYRILKDLYSIMDVGAVAGGGRGWHAAGVFDNTKLSVDVGMFSSKKQRWHISSL